MPLIWIGEAYDYPADRESGATTVRLTTTLKHHINVYGEHAYCSPDGKRIAILRSACADPRLPPFDLLVGDLSTLRIALLETDVAGYLVAAASWGGWVYYLTRSKELWRVSLVTLEKQLVWSSWPFSPDFILHTVSPDHRYLIGQLPQASYDTALVRLDLDARTWKTIFEHPEISNAHPIFNPIHGRDLIVMMARGYKVNDRQDVRPVEGSLRATTHIYLDADGGNLRHLPLGPPHTAELTGHSNWIADTGRMAATTLFDWKTMRLPDAHPGGNLISAAPGDAKPRVFQAPEHRFNHLAVSRCGRYFVADSYLHGIPGPIPLVVGNFETGKYRNLLADCRASGGASACSHPHPYFTTDNTHVIYNADPYMVGHVYAARVPEGFLKSLS